MTVQPLSQKIQEARNRLAMIELRINEVERCMSTVEERQYRTPAKQPPPPPPPITYDVNDPLVLNRQRIPDNNNAT